MNRSSGVIENLQSSIECSAETYRIPSCIKSTILLLPFVLMLVSAALFALPPTRSVMFWMMKENRPVELLTAIM
ncbi:MAG: hypothetical protein KJN98_07325, partial [Pontiella sp.]|nr:hypothetical protein [Pontiella sp.]